MNGVLKRRIRRVALTIVSGCLLILVVILYNTWRFESKQGLDRSIDSVPALPEGALVHFQEAIRYRTISYYDSSQFDSAAFKGFHRHLQKSYPLIHKALTREIINNYTLLYTWKGADTTKRPIILLAHMDVVPIEQASMDLWEADPFGGELKHNFIWGRGSMDNKVNLVSIMEAAESLLANGIKPQRTIYFVFGHDEEIGGPNGARAAAELLKSRGIKADLVLDEGGIITTNKIPNMDKQVALLGTSEKSMLTLTLTVEKNGGHSSMPEKETALDILAKALVKVRSNPFPGRITPAQKDFIEHVGPELPYLQRMIFANTWLFENVIIDLYSKSAVGNAVMRTTVVPTIFTAGVKDNIIPTNATATINLRLLPGDDVQYAIERIEATIDDERVQVNKFTSSDPSGYTDPGGFGFETIRKTVRKTFPATVTTPFLIIGGTDSRHFSKVSDNIIRFTPLIDPIGLHVINERVSVEGFRSSVWFYEQLIRDVN